MPKIGIFIFFIFSFFTLPTFVSAENLSIVRYQEPDYLTFEEIQSLSEYPEPHGPLKAKLSEFWRTPLISNEAFYRGVQPFLPSNDKLGQYLRIVTWNIEKSLNVDLAIELLKASEAEFNEMLDEEKFEEGSETHQNLIRQRNRLLNADVLVLQEMEIGVKRSNYWNAAKKIAEALDMNYVYGAQYLEVDPVLLGTQHLHLEEGGIDREAEKFYRVDPEKFKGVFGSAILSRYPIKNVDLRPLKTQPYDWYRGELKKISFLEVARRKGAKTVFENEMTREMKVGGRHYFRADLHIPQIPGETLTIINIHLEIKCKPEDRKEQLEEILSYIKHIKHPVIMLGDFNAAPTDISPTSVTRVVKRTAKNPSTWLGVALTAAGSQLNVPRLATNYVKNFNDPFAPDIKVVAPNPLKPMFEMIREFKFDDGYVFDFRGNKNRSINNNNELLSNSNERGLKGFKTTFSVKRPLGIVGKYRLDWVFVKSVLKTNDNNLGPYRLSPHFGETLEELNTSLTQPISDHHPSVVDIPLSEPNLENLAFKEAA